MLWLNYVFFSVNSTVQLIYCQILMPFYPSVCFTVNSEIFVRLVFRKFLISELFELLANETVYVVFITCRDSLIVRTLNSRVIEFANIHGKLKSSQTFPNLSC